MNSKKQHVGAPPNLLRAKLLLNAGKNIVFRLIMAKTTLLLVLGHAAAAVPLQHYTPPTTTGGVSYGIKGSFISSNSVVKNGEPLKFELEFGRGNRFYLARFGETNQFTSQMCSDGDLFYSWRNDSQSSLDGLVISPIERSATTLRDDMVQRLIRAAFWPDSSKHTITNLLTNLPNFSQPSLTNFLLVVSSNYTFGKVTVMEYGINATRTSTSSGMVLFGKITVGYRGGFSSGADADFIRYEQFDYTLPRLFTPRRDVMIDIQKLISTRPREGESLYVPKRPRSVYVDDFRPAGLQGTNTLSRYTLRPEEPLINPILHGRTPAKKGRAQLLLLLLVAASTIGLVIFLRQVKNNKQQNNEHR